MSDIKSSAGLAEVPHRPSLTVSSRGRRWQMLSS